MKFVPIAAILSVALSAEVSAASPALADLSLEELANIQVTSVSRRSESLAGAPASIFVLTSEDIRRSGATTLPEALRLAPNLQVARVDARNYAISARGFNNPFSNKLLVMVDGRTIYSPLFSGVFWDIQDVVMEDIDRIEVISGPGSTLWGANAVNGVINITTKSADSTQGNLASVTGGRDFRDISLRHGGKLEGGGHFRVWAKMAENEDARRSDGRSQLDGYHRKRIGLRGDWASGNRSVTLQADAYNGRLGQSGTPDILVGGAHVLGRFTERLSGTDELQVKGYLDHTERDQPQAYREHLDTLDLEAQRTLTLDRHQLVFGGGYRHGYDRVVNGTAFGFLPDRLRMNWANLFIEDSIELTPHLQLVLGHKVERNPWTGNEHLPNIRLAWRPSSSHLLWSSLSRSVRAPSRIDRDFYAPTNGLPAFTVAGGPNFRSEVAKVFELGYRGQPRNTLSWSATAWYARYERLRTLEPAAGGALFRNNAEGASRGLEFNATWRVQPAWRLVAGAVMQRVETRVLPGVTDISVLSNLAVVDPSSWWQLRSSWNLGESQELDLVLRHVGQFANRQLPAYTALDMRYAFKLSSAVELAVIGQNLLPTSHPEFGANAVTRSEFMRQMLVKVTWRQ